jgi:hypothetical protein
MIEIQMVTASERQQSYGIRFVSPLLYDVAGPGLHNPSLGHLVQVWDNTGRENTTPDTWNQFVGKPGPGRYLSPDGKGTDEARTVLLSAQPDMITSPPTLTAYGDGVLRVGDDVRLVIDGAASDYRITARSLADPELKLNNCPGAPGGPRRRRGTRRVYRGRRESESIMWEKLLDGVMVGRSAEGDRIFLEVEIQHFEGRDCVTVDHEPIASYTRVSISGLGYRKHARNATSAGQIIGDAESVLHGGRVAPGVERADLARLLDIWREWHLNDMVAECVHQTPTGEGISERLRQTPACPVTGYKYGTLWLVRPVPADVIAELRLICERITQANQS